MMRPCEQVLPQDKAEGVRQLLVKLTGQECACDRGVRCPLFPELQVPLLPEPAHPPDEVRIVA